MALVPEVGKVYGDGERTLAVLELEEGNREGRQVRGLVSRNGSEPAHYATSIHNFQAIWTEVVDG